MSTTRCAWLGVPAVIVLLGVHATAAPQTLRGIAVEETLDASPVLSEAVAQGTPAAGLPLLVRLTIDEASFRGAAATSAFERLDARCELYRRRDVTVILALGAFPASDPDVDPWLQFVRSVVAHLKGRVRAYQVGDVTRASLADADRYTYVLKRASTEIKSVDPDALVLQGPVPALAVDFLARTYRAGAAPYSDGVAVDVPVPPPVSPVSQAASRPDAQDGRAVEAIAQLVEHEDPTASIVMGSVRLPDEIGRATAQLSENQLWTVGTRVGVIAYTAGAETLRAVLVSVAHVADVLGGDVVTLDEPGMNLQFVSGAADVSPSVPHRLLYSQSASSTYLVYWPDARISSLDLEITTAAMTTPAVRDPLTGESRPLTLRRLAGGARVRLTLPVASHALILDFNAGEKTYSAQADVRAVVLPPVEEIIAKAQQAQAADDAELTRYIAHVRVETHFRPVPADPAYNVVTENRLFVDRSGVEWEELSFSMNGATWTANRPGFPLLQPEKVLSLPLDLRLNQDYTYRLTGVEVVGGRQAFVVEFTPTSASRALYRGTVWIDRQTFVRLEVHAVETHLAGPIVSNDETEIFEPAGVIAGGPDGAERPVWLLDHATNRQVLLIAGRSVPLERDIHFSEFQLNAATFDETRATARAGDRIMYRDTDQGLRYFVKQGDTRVVSDTLTTSARALVMGADIDPSFTRPLPIAGLDLLDFNFMHKNMQLALLFGGVLGTGNIQRAGLVGGKINVSLDFFGIAIKAQDVIFDGAGERTGERVLSIPASMGLNVGWQFAAFQKITARYELRYDAYFRDPATAPAFVLPANTTTNSVEAGYEYRRGGYSVTGNAATYRRSTWTSWGMDGDFDPSTRTYMKYQAQASKDFVLNTFHTIHVNAAYFGGERLDRFSMYRFGLFDDNKIHGVPSAVRLSTLAMVRGSYAFNVFDQYRIDVSLDRARGQDTASGAWQTLTGVGVGLNLRGPRNTILRTDIGKSVLPPVYRGSGSYRIQFMLLKPLK